MASGLIIHPAITIPTNASTITAGRDGTVFVTKPCTAVPVQVGQLQLATFINSAGLESKGLKLYAETPASTHQARTGQACSRKGTWKPRMLTSPRNW